MKPPKNRKPELKKNNKPPPRFNVALISSWTKTKRDSFFKELTDDEAAILANDWTFWAGEGQLPPDPEGESGWTTWLFMGGRGAGKTRAGAEWISALVATAPEPLRIALVAENYGDARMTMIEGASGILSVGSPLGRPNFFPALRKLEWPNGSMAHMFSSEDPEALRGPQFHAAWSDEIAKWRYADETWSNLQMALRLGQRPRQVVTTTPRPVKHLKEIIDDPGTVMTHATSYDNAKNLAPAFLTHIVRRYEGTSLGRQELDGILMSERKGALFRREDIESARLRVAPELERVVVAVDPPVTAKEDSDECGIVIAGLMDGHAYVLADYTVQGLSPRGWATRVVEAAHDFEVDRVVVEVNQGGDLVEAVLRQVEPNLPVRPVFASRGKRVRAEPVASLYEQGKVHHIGLFAELEDQLTDFGAGPLAVPSPDRLDALVWALTDLMLKSPNASPRFRKL